MISKFLIMIILFGLSTGSFAATVSPADLMKNPLVQFKDYTLKSTGIGYSGKISDDDPTLVPITNSKCPITCGKGKWTSKKYTISKEEGVHKGGQTQE